ncbi:MAG: hypothetical protein WCJ24_00790 [Candidatus Saccharibacteria bacterium]
MNKVLKALRLRRRNLNPEKFIPRWKELQKMLCNKEQWSDAIIAADKLLDEALRKLHYKGKTTGERMVSAHTLFSDIDGVWFGHKLRKNLESNTPPKLKEKDVKHALMGIGQALKDVGALK